jgi:hypothetical protein
MFENAQTPATMAPTYAVGDWVHAVLARFVYAVRVSTLGINMILSSFRDVVV